MLAGTHWMNAALHRMSVTAPESDVFHTYLLTLNEYRRLSVADESLIRALGEIEDLRPPYVRGNLPAESGRRARAGAARPDPRQGRREHLIMLAVRVVPGPEGGTVEVHDVPDLLRPGPVLIRVRASGLNRGEIGQPERCARETRRRSALSSRARSPRWAPASGGWRRRPVMGHGRGGQAQYVWRIRAPSCRSRPGCPGSRRQHFLTSSSRRTMRSSRTASCVPVNPYSSTPLRAESDWPPFRSPRRSGPIRSWPPGARREGEAPAEFGVMVAIDTSRESQVDAVMAATNKKGVDIIDSVGGTVFEANPASSRSKAGWSTSAGSGRARPRSISPRCG